MAFGNAEQQKRFLPRILSAEDWWCQGYSEPGAGSDLASLKTRADRQGDHYIVNGQKTWNTMGQHANWIFCLVRTDPNAPKPQSQAFAKVETWAKKFAEGEPAKNLPWASWSSHEQVHFVQSLPNLYPEHLESLDSTWHLSDSGNSEVLSAWLEKALDSGYNVHPAIERFLTTQGRRKFLRPLYEKMAKSPGELAFAKQVYAKARPTYHPVSRATIDTILQWK